MIHLRQNVGCLGYVNFSFSHLHILSCLHSTPPIFLKMFRQQFWDQKDVDLNRSKLDPIIPPCPHNFLNKCQGLLSINVETCACPVRKGTNCGNHKTSYPVSKIINKMQNPGGLEHARNLPFKYPHLKKRNPNVPCQFHVSGNGCCRCPKLQLLAFQQLHEKISTASARTVPGFFSFFFFCFPNYHSLVCLVQAKFVIPFPGHHQTCFVAPI